MIDKTVATCDEAVRDVFDGATLMFGGKFLGIELQ